MIKGKTNLTILKKLGEGSFGTVYLAKDQNDVKYALKSISTNLFERQQQEKEIQISKLLNHPNIIKVISDWSDDQNLEILMEYCEGGHIGNYNIKQLQNINSCDILNIIQQIVRAGISMSEQGIIHRDLKPENVVLENNSVPKIIDFGCAKKICPSKIYEQINSSFDKGSPFHISPELLRSEEYSAKCDIWGVGCIAYELQYKKRVFMESDSKEIIEKVKAGPIDEFIKIMPHTDLRIAEFLNLTLKDREQERASWNELILSRIFAPSIQSKQRFIEYLQNIFEITKWITTSLREHSHKFQEKTLKLFFYFMLKFHHSLIMLILSILENKPKFLYLFDQSCKNEEMKKNHDAIREWKFKGTRTKEVLDKLHKSLEQKDYFKEALTQTPKKRNSYFSDLDFSIRYGKAILKEKLQKKSNEHQKDEWDLWIALTKWVNFEKWMSFEEFPDLRKLLGEVPNPEEWIKKQF